MSTKLALVPNKVPVVTVNTVPGTCKYRGASTLVKYKVYVHSFPWWRNADPLLRGLIRHGCCCGFVVT